MKVLHTRTKIFFPNPSVIKVDLPSTDFSDSDGDRVIRKIKKYCSQNTRGTWGYSNIYYGNFYNSTTNSFISDKSCYFCFLDEADVLQFKLSCPTTAYRVHIWPTMDFTIFEHIDE